MQANTQKIRQVDVQGGFTAAAGHNFYTARAFPQEYWNRVAFVNEPTGHVVHRAIIERKGSGFAEKDGWNVAASDDEWFAPVHAEVGPDGALWFLDFYDFIIQHNPTPVGPVAQGYQYLNGRGNAYDTPLREQRSAAAIYRLVWKGAKPYTPMSLERRPAGRARRRRCRTTTCSGALTAQRLLVERGKRRRAAAAHRASSTTAPSTRSASTRRAVHALWTMHGLGVLDGTNAAALDAAKRALTHPAAGVRKAAQSVLPKTAQSVTDLLAAGALDDKDLNVRLNALLALSQMPASAEAGRAIYAASKEKEVIADEWLPEAVWIAADASIRTASSQAYAAEVGLGEFVRIARARRARRASRRRRLVRRRRLDETGWMTIAAPRVWAETPLGEHVGTVWFRRAIDVPATRRRQARDASASASSTTRTSPTSTASRSTRRRTCATRRAVLDSGGRPGRRPERRRRAHLERQRPRRVRARPDRRAGARRQSGGVDDAHRARRSPAW